MAGTKAQYERFRKALASVTSNRRKTFERSQAHRPSVLSGFLLVLFAFVVWLANYAALTTAEGHPRLVNATATHASEDGAGVHPSNDELLPSQVSEHNDHDGHNGLVVTIVLALSVYLALWTCLDYFAFEVWDAQVFANAFFLRAFFCLLLSLIAGHPAIWDLPPLRSIGFAGDWTLRMLDVSTLVITVLFAYMDFSLFRYYSEPPLSTHRPIRFRGYLFATFCSGLAVIASIIALFKPRESTALVFVAAALLLMAQCLFRPPYPRLLFVVDEIPILRSFLRIPAFQRAFALLLASEHESNTTLGHLKGIVTPPTVFYGLPLLGAPLEALVQLRKPPDINVQDEMQVNLSLVGKPTRKQ
jgi:hypothetical protein